MTAVAEKPDPKPAGNPADDQLAARIRAADDTQTVSGKDVAKWTVSERTAVGKLLSNPPRLPWEVHDKFPDAVAALGRTKAERLVASIIAKRIEQYDRQRSELDKAFAERRELAVEVAEAKAAASEANKAYSEAKAEYEAADQRIINLASARRNGQNTLPLEQPEDANGQVKPSGKGDPADSAPVEDLDLGKRITEGMHAADLKTIGSLIKFIATDEWWHRKIKGVGESGVDKITDALNAWRENNEPLEDGE